MGGEQRGTSGREPRRLSRGLLFWLGFLKGWLQSCFEHGWHTGRCAYGHRVSEDTQAIQLEAQQRAAEEARDQPRAPQTDPASIVFMARPPQGDRHKLN